MPETTTTPQLSESDKRTRRVNYSPCDVCGKSVTTAGYGRTQHMRTHSRPAVPDEKARVRFERQFTIQSNGCWFWNSVCSGSPYGSFHFSGRRYMAFIFSWWLYRGELVKSPPLELDHLCRNKRCVNPEHLEPVTRAENNRRARKQHCPQGHAYTPENTGRGSKGERYCKQCGRNRNRRYYDTHPEFWHRLNQKRREQRRQKANA